jgi:hypothetical protein
MALSLALLSSSKIRVIALLEKCRVFTLRANASTLRKKVDVIFEFRSLS